MARKNKLKRRILDYFFSTICQADIATEVNYNKLKEITVTLYKWLNMPDEIDQRFLELTLFERGHVLFLKDELLDGFAVMRSANTGKWNIYDVPKRRRAYASNGYNWTFSPKDSVIIYNNVLRTSSEMETRYYAEKLAHDDIIIDLNLKAQKTPFFIRCAENQRLTMMNLYMKYDGSVPVIFGDKNLDASPLEVLQTGAPFIAKDVYDLKVKYWNEFLTFKGISNVNINKKERLTTDEVTRQLGGSIAARGSGLLMRKEACKQINELFGLNIDVAFNEDVVMRIMDEADELVDENEITDLGGAENE